MKRIVTYLFFLLVSSAALASRNKEALEDFDISQLRVIRVSKNAECRFAIILDPNERAHIVHIGSIIGKNSGKIIEMNASFVTIAEPMLSEKDNEPTDRKFTIPVKPH